MLALTTSGFTQDITVGRATVLTVMEAHQTTTLMATETFGRPTVLFTTGLFLVAVFLLVFGLALFIVAQKR